MDPAAVFAIVTGSAGLVLKCASVIKGFNNILGQYKHVELSILSMVQSLDTIRIAWEEIGQWADRYATTLGSDGPPPLGDEKEETLLRRLNRSLEVGTMIMDAFDRELLPCKKIDDLKFSQISRSLWNATTLKEHQERISHQAIALTCLMQAVQLKSSSERTARLQDAKRLLQRSDESAYSIVPSRMSISTYHSSISNESTEMIYRRLSCEDQLFSARVYKRNYRTPLIRQLFHLKRRQRGSVSTRSEWVVRLRALKMAKVEPSPMPTAHVSFASECEHQHAMRKQTGSELDGDELAFLEACSWGDADWVEEILQEKLNAEKQPTFLTPSQAFRAVNEAVIFRQLDVLKILQANGAFIKSRIATDSSRSWHPLQWAAYSGNVTMIQALLQANVPIHVHRENTGSHPLHIASHMGFLEVIDLLLDTGIPANVPDLWNLQPLHIASQYHSRARQIRLLVTKGADIEAAASFPSPIDFPARALQQARYASQAENVQTLLSLGAKDEAEPYLKELYIGRVSQQPVSKA